MAGDWMKVEHSTPEKPEVFGIAATLSITPDEAFGVCFRMWRWFDQHTQNGNARSVTPALLDRYLGVPGFTQACVSVGWLVIAETGLSLPHFDRHNGQTAKSRGLTYNRVKSHRQKTKRDCNAAIVSQSLPENREQSIDIPPPLPLPRDAKTEEEEEKLQNLVKTLRADPYQVNDAVTAVEQATASGCTVDDILAIATQWALADKWSSAQLWHRINRAMPGESPVANWPPPDAAKQQRSRRGTGDPETDAANREYLERERMRRDRQNQTRTQTPESLAVT